jgi:hypothetical protein
MKKNCKFLITGLVRNCESTIKLDIQLINKSIKKYDMNPYWLVIESDSSDDTLKQLEILKFNNNNFRYISLGNLKNKIKKRTDRLAYCRNVYLEQIKKIELYKNIDYVLIVDLDHLNNRLSDTSVESCFANNNWDVCSANQDGPYYDIAALRHKEWSPNDCWQKYKFFLSIGISKEDALVSAVHSRMIKIDKNSKWIEVDSAFGGAAIYKRKIFNLPFLSYKGHDNSSNEICEHLSFHSRIRKNGYKIYINPKFINAAYTDHTQHLFFHKKLMRLIKNSLHFLSERLL